jgi:hypothetical protein
MKNEYKIEGNVVTIFVESPKYGHKEILVDLEGFFKINREIKGTIGVGYYLDVKDFYAVYYDGNKVQRLHRFLMDFPDILMVDHINHNTLDNRFCNLRTADRYLNGENHKRKTSSKYPGVCWNKRAKKWEAYIKIEGKKHHLGYFEVEEDAHEAYQKRLKEVRYAQNSFKAEDLAALNMDQAKSKVVRADMD